MPPPKPVEIERPETPPRVRDKLVAGELLYARLAEKVDGMADAQDEIKTDMRELRKQMGAHEDLNAKRSLAREESERALRGEITALRDSTAQGFEKQDARLDKLTTLVGVLVDRQPQTPPVEAAPPPGPITSALGLAPRHPARTGSTAAVAGGGVSLAAVLGILVQLGGLPVAVQWVLGVLAVMVGVTACVVVGVRMTRRD